jgi:hypothetical protein
LIAAVRRVIREVPGAAEVAAAQCTGHDYGDAGKPKIAWDDQEARAVLVDALVTDALSLLGHLPEQEPLGDPPPSVGSVRVLRRLHVLPAIRASSPTAARRQTVWCLSSIPTRGTSTKTAPATRKGSKLTCPSSPRPGCSPPSRSPGAAARAITRPPSTTACWAAMTAS